MSGFAWPLCVARISIALGSSYWIIFSKHAVTALAWVSSVARLPGSLNKGRTRSEEEWRISTARIVTRTTYNGVIINHHVIRAILADPCHASGRIVFANGRKYGPFRCGHLRRIEVGVDAGVQIGREAVEKKCSGNTLWIETLCKQIF